MAIFPVFLNLYYRHLLSKKNILKSFALSSRCQGSIYGFQIVTFPVSFICLKPVVYLKPLNGYLHFIRVRDCLLRLKQPPGTNTIIIYKILPKIPYSTKWTIPYSHQNTKGRLLSIDGDNKKQT